MHVVNNLSEVCVLTIAVLSEDSSLPGIKIHHGEQMWQATWTASFLPESMVVIHHARCMTLDSSNLKVAWDMLRATAAGLAVICI